MRQPDAAERIGELLVSVAAAEVVGQGVARGDEHVDVGAGAMVEPCGEDGAAVSTNPPSSRVSLPKQTSMTERQRRHKVPAGSGSRSVSMRVPEGISGRRAKGLRVVALRAIRAGRTD